MSRSEYVVPKVDNVVPVATPAPLVFKAPTPRVVVNTSPPYVDPLLLNNYDVRPRTKFNSDEGRNLLLELEKLENTEQ